MERNTSFTNHCLRLTVLCSLLFILVSCERTAVPVISKMRVQEVEAAVVEVTATITASKVDECGICYSTKNTSPTPEANEGVVYGTMEGDQFSVRATLKAWTTYYIAIFATNEAGRTTTNTALKITTSHCTPDKKDNPLPNF
jgi:hypothetical protein